MSNYLKSTIGGNKMEDIKEANIILEKFNDIVNTGKFNSFDEEDELKVGIDLGTSSIVLVILNSKNQPVYGSFEYANVVRDGLVVDYINAVEIVNRLKQEAEKIMSVELTKASGSVPPGTVHKNKAVVGNVIESADMEVVQIVDEPTAASCLLKIYEGAVVDVGGGTTGISTFSNGQVEYIFDEPTGGSHMTLVLAGYYKILIEEAEQLKRNKQKEKQNFLILQPVVEKMAEITQRSLEKAGTNNDYPIYLVGGASNFTDFAPTFSKYLNRTVIKPKFPQFVTPIGIAMSCGKEEN